MRNRAGCWVELLVFVIGVGSAGVAPLQAAAASSSKTCSVLIVLPPRASTTAASEPRLATDAIAPDVNPAVQQIRTVVGDGTVLYTETPIL